MVRRGERRGSRFARAGLAGALIALALPATAGAAAWTPPVQWNTSGDGGVGITSLAVAATPAGDALAVWAAGGGSALRARWQYAGGGSSAVFDPLGGAGLIASNVGQLIAYGDRQAVYVFTGAPSVSDPHGVYARRISETATAPPISLSDGIDTSTRTVGASFTLTGTTAGEAIVGFYDADKNQPTGPSTAEVRNARLRVLPPTGAPGPLLTADSQNDRTELVSTGLPPPNDMLPATSSGTDQPSLWLNAAGKGVVATRRLVDPASGTTHVWRLRSFDAATATLGSPFEFGAPAPDPYTVGSTAFAAGPSGDGALFWSLTGNTTAGGLIAGAAMRPWSAGAAGATTTLDPLNWGQTVTAVRDDAGRTIVAWGQRFTVNPHPSMTVRRLGADLAPLRADEELPAPIGLIIGLAPAANGARLFSRQLVTSNSYQLSDRVLPADGPAGPIEPIGAPAVNLGLAAAPMRASDGTLTLALRQRGGDGKDELWVTRLAGSAAGGGPPSGGTDQPSRPGQPGPPAPGASKRPAISKVGQGSLRVGRSGAGRLKLRCVAAGACVVKLRAVKGKTLLATARGTVPAGRTAEVRVGLTKSARARLARGGRKLLLVLTGTVTSAGSSSPVSIRVVARRG